MKNKHILYIFLILIIVNLCCQSGNKNNLLDKTTKKNKNLFESKEILEINLETNFEKLFSDIDERRFYHPAKISYVNEKDSIISLDIEIKTRGNFRRDSDYCNFPPIKLKFDKKKKKRKKTIFAKETKLKLVTHCQNDSSEYEQYLLAEYLLYRVYNILTNKSYRVRLAKIMYIDTDDTTQQKSKTITHYGFFIESSKKMAKRNDAKVLKKPYLEQNQLNYDGITLLSVFQYMIANADWSVWYLHNITLISDKSKHPPSPVPYDFDFSGIINASYAEPISIFELDSIRQRLHLGYCNDTIQLDYIFSIFNEKRTEIYELYNNFPLLKNKYKKQTLDFFDEFYNIINNKKMIEKEFLSSDKTNVL